MFGSVKEALSPEAILGGSYDELSTEGAKRYPSIPRGSQHHALAAERAAGKFGFMGSQVLGLGVEALEHLPVLSGGSAPAWEDTKEDLKANWTGGMVGSRKKSKKKFSEYPKVF